MHTKNQVNEPQRCTRCILPNSLQSIRFNEEGVCNYCRKFEQDFAGWDQIAERKQAEFEVLLEHARRLKRSYDCLVPLSGGKDSTFALYLASKVYKLKCLAVTYDNGFLTIPAKNNIARALESTTADHIFYHMNKKTSVEMFRTFLVKTGEFCNSCMRGINYSIEMAARTYKIPLVIKGSGRRVQYVSQISELSGLNTSSFVKNVINKEPIENQVGQLGRNRFYLEWQKILGGVCDVAGVPRYRLMRFSTQYVGMYDYYYKPYPEIVKILETEMGWSSAHDSVEHLDCDLHGIPFYIQTLLIPGITSETLRNSALIRQGIMTREEALRIENERLAQAPAPSELQTFLRETGLERGEFEEYVRNGDASRFESGFQKKIRKLYHAYRKY